MTRDEFAQYVTTFTDVEAFLAWCEQTSTDYRSTFDVTEQTVADVLGPEYAYDIGVAEVTEFIERDPMAQRHGA
jgi:hypothetical protein